MSTSIVIVTYNSTEYINNLLHSIKDQQGINHRLEVIVVDNNSSDVAILKKIIRSSSIRQLHIKLYLRKKNYGFGSSSNFGAHQSTCQNICFINPDTVLNPDAIYNFHLHLKNGSGDVIGGKTYKLNNTNIHRTVFNSPNFKTMLFEFSNLGKIFKIRNDFYIPQENIDIDTYVNGVSAAFLMLKKSVFYEIGEFDENFFMYLEDVDLCTRLRKAGYKIIYCPHSKIIHIGGASSQNKHKINYEGWNKSRIYYAYKYMSPLLFCILKSVYSLEDFVLYLYRKLS